jgi:RimJ/RimL family protein N-acetyltransferase
MMVLETDRLVLRRFTHDDAPFVLELLNDSDFLRFIGDRQVRTLDGARTYIADRLIRSYETYGYGLYHTARKSDGAAVGMCGLVKRDALESADIGYALLPAYRGLGFAREAAAGVLSFARKTLGLPRILAVVQADNADSIRLLQCLGMTFERCVALSEGAPELRVYGIDLS